MKKVFVSIVLASSIILSSAASAASAAVYADKAATRGEVVEMLLTAADDYNAGVKKSDIIKGEGDGVLHEERGVTRAEALVMLKRAFGEIPEISGANKYLAYPAENFTDIPDWAVAELSDIFASGIVAGTGDNKFSPDDGVTVDEMKLFINRMYTVFGTNLKDDYYAAVNKEYLDNVEIGEGKRGSTKSEDVDDKIRNEINQIIKDCASGKITGKKAEMVKTLYNNILDKKARDAQGIEPIRPYLDMIDGAANMDELRKVDMELDSKDLVSMFYFHPYVDLADSNHYITAFEYPVPLLSKEVYLGEIPELKDAYMTYMEKLLTLSGCGAEEAEKCAEDYFKFESELSAAELNPEEVYDIEKTYNIYTLDELDALYPNVNVKAYFEASGLTYKDKILIFDLGNAAKANELMAEDNFKSVKNYLKIKFIKEYALRLSTEFEKAARDFANARNGITGYLTDEDYATDTVSNTLVYYIGDFYFDAHCSEETVRIIKELIKEVKDVYKERIENNDWLGKETKAKALKKLDAMREKVGKPENAEDIYAEVNLKSYADGGSYFENLRDIYEADMKNQKKLDGGTVDKSEWIMSPQTVNACYDFVTNDITIPAGYLQPPIYSDNMSYEEILAGIGNAVGHEISHAFDSDGSQYDENGNAVDWWTAEDKAEFKKRCNAVEDFFKDSEGAPGIPTNTALTLTENIADLGAMSCMLELASKYDNFDYDKMFRAYADSWAGVYTRGFVAEMARTDSHSMINVRTNRVLQAFDKFYETYDIKEGDGMYIAPEDRVTIW